MPSGQEFHALVAQLLALLGENTSRKSTLWIRGWRPLFLRQPKTLVPLEVAHMLTCFFLFTP